MARSVAEVALRLHGLALQPELGPGVEQGSQDLGGAAFENLRLL